MANFHGKGGSITWAGSGTESTEILSWSLEASADVAETTNMASANDYKTYLAGFKDWTASIEVVLDAALGDLPMLATSGALALLTGGGTITGTGICTNISYGVDSTDKGTATYSFQGSGQLVVS